MTLYVTSLSNEQSSSLIGIIISEIYKQEMSPFACILLFFHSLTIIYKLIYRLKKKIVKS